MFHNTTLHLLNNPEKMLRSLNNNTSAFSMENLLSREKLSPENLEIIDRNAEDIDRSSLENFRLNQSDKKPSSSPSETTRSEGENDRLSPVISPEKNDLFLRFNNCFKNSGICSSCGRLDCNFFQCRMNDVNVVKDNKPVLKFSVSAILGTENQPKHIQNESLVHVTPPSLLGLGSYLGSHGPGIAKPVASRPAHFNPHILLAHCRPQPYLTG
ncbi:hypothetical protein QE152_g1552 [Popillia japonica]|uniref:Uncharacterized protein n=1 Tax=Popillia japonica TaxID=7064 RepID=A0AAW1N3J2_POPJA